jgi:hypothetical protein
MDIVFLSLAYMTWASMSFISRLLNEVPKCLHHDWIEHFIQSELAYKNRMDWPGRAHTKVRAAKCLMEQDWQGPPCSMWI